MLFSEGLHGFTRTRRLVRFLLRRKATINANFNMLRQRWDDMKVLCLQMMGGIERRALLYVSMNGTHSDLSVVMVVALLIKYSWGSCRTAKSKNPTTSLHQLGGLRKW